MFLAFLVVLIVLILFVDFPGFLKNKTTVDDSITKSLRGCHDNSSVVSRVECYNRLFTKYTEDHSVEILLAEFKTAMVQDGQTRQDCHQIAHAIGRVALTKLGNITKVFQLDRNLDTCTGGFFHGAIEKLFRPDDNLLSGESENHIGLEEFRSKIPTLCDRFEKLDKKSECVHGVGHGTLFLLGNLNQALDACQLFRQKTDYFGCYAGVFMEYSISGRSLEDNKRDRQFPCEQFSESRRNPCYYVQSFRLVEMGLPPDKIVEECRKAPGAAGGLCVRGYGIFFLAHEALANGPELIVEFCEKLDRPNARVCAESVASRLAAHTETGEYAMPFCSLFSLEYLRGRCFSYIGDVLRLGHKVSLRLIVEDCNKYAANPNECLASVKD